MDIFYSDDTLFVNVYENINEDNISSLKTRVFKIARDYDIENIVLTKRKEKETQKNIRN